MKPIDALKKGLGKLCKQVQEWKVKLIATLKAGGSIPDNDQEWLDGEKNLIYEVWVVETLDGAFDYEHGLERLDLKGKSVAQQLLKLGSGKRNNVPFKKWKCRLQDLSFSCFQCYHGVYLL
ncbi:hypothetical protein JVU11DRAFT_7277 [Chiua virens]|nr:hypothetical protein JVU11DRAFT_7277 [Chiua virens]